MAYLLGTLDFPRCLALQQRLAFDASEERGSPAVILCDHPQGITIGRHGSRVHIRCSVEELTARRWDVRWVARGGGVLLHLPGQLACYPILPLRGKGLSPTAYVHSLIEVAADLCRGFGLPTTSDTADGSIRVNGRRIAAVGVAIRNWVTSCGIIVNVAPDLELFRGIDCEGDPVAMTSLQRECPTPVRVPAVRQRLLELLVERFEFDRMSVFHNHPSLQPRSPRHAAAPGPREAR